MLWAIKDNRFDYYGPDITVVRARNREEALLLWARERSDLYHITGEIDPSEQEVFDAIKDHDRPLTVRVQCIQLDAEGVSGILVDRDVPELPVPEPEPMPEHRPSMVSLEGQPFRNMEVPAIRVVCTNTMRAAFRGKR